MGNIKNIREVLENIVSDVDIMVSTSSRPMYIYIRDTIFLHFPQLWCPYFYNMYRCVERSRTPGGVTALYMTSCNVSNDDYDVIVSCQLVLIMNKYHTRCQRVHVIYRLLDDRCLYAKPKWHLRMIDWLIDWLVFNGTSTQKSHLFVPICLGGNGFRPLNEWPPINNAWHLYVTQL